MTYSVKNQQGLTLITIVFILVIFGFFVMLGLKIGPIYLNHSKVVNSLAAIEEMPDVTTLTKGEVSASLYKRFDMNYVTKVDSNDITITKQEHYLKVEIQYERVEKIIGNLSVLVEFYEVLELGYSE